MVSRSLEGVFLKGPFGSKQYSRGNFCQDWSKYSGEWISGNIRRGKKSCLGWIIRAKRFYEYIKHKGETTCLHWLIGQQKWSPVNIQRRWKKPCRYWCPRRTAQRRSYQHL